MPALGGRLITIVSESTCFRHTRKIDAFWEQMPASSAEIKLEAGTFKESGTLIPASLLVFDKAMPEYTDAALESV